MLTDLPDHVRFPCCSHGRLCRNCHSWNDLSWHLALFLECKSHENRVNVFFVQSLVCNGCLIVTKWMILFCFSVHSLFGPPHAGSKETISWYFCWIFNLSKNLASILCSAFSIICFGQLVLSLMWRCIWGGWSKQRKESRVVLGKLFKSLQNL